MPNWEPAADRGLWVLCDPRFKQPSQDEEEVLLWSEELGVNIAVCLRLQLISHTQPISNHSGIKCERYIFIKKCVRSFIADRHKVDYVSTYICICMWLYNIYDLVPGVGSRTHGVISNQNWTRRSKERPKKNQEQNATLRGRKRHEKKEEK